MKVLVIEDDEVQHELLKAVFAQVGADALFCKTGEDGLERLKTHFFDIVLLDLGLPGKSGLQVLKTIRENVLTKEIAVIVFTATKTRESLALCMKYGINDYIAKPFQPATFTKKLDNLRRELALKTTVAKEDAAHVILDRMTLVAKFTFGGVFNDDSVRKFLQYYTPAFQNQTKNNEVLLNFAALPNMTAPQLRMFKLITSAIFPKKPLIVAGRSYGPLLGELSDYEDRLFITEEDALEFLNKH
ncbi:MAG TPA: response regulator [Turneriella sp.]|nr:response regulator [Turneriella sp.]